MKVSSSIRTLSVLASAAMILGAFVAPADAKKKKKPKPPPPPPACAPYVPGDAGKEAPITVVTDAATAEAPVVVDLTAAEGLPSTPTVNGIGFDGTTSVFQNVQVDTAKPSAGLYVKIEFADNHDYDLYLLHPDGSEAANSGDANAVHNNGFVGGGSPDGGWASGSNFESVTGINTLDCAGYTADVLSYLTTGGAVKMTIWLGDALVEPNPPA